MSFKLLYFLSISNYIVIVIINFQKFINNIISYFVTFLWAARMRVTRGYTTTFCIEGYNVHVCLCLIVKYVSRATFNIGRCSIQCHYSCLCFNSTKSNGIRKIILQQYKSRPTSYTCNLGGKICVLPN